MNRGINRADSMDEVELPIFYSMRGAIDHPRRTEADLQPYPTLVINPSSTNESNTTTSEVTLLTLEKLEQISASLGIKLPNDLLEFAAGYEKTSSLNQVHLLAWGERTISAEAYQIAFTPDDMPNRAVNGTHYLKERRRKAGYILLATIESSDTMAVSSFKATVREPKTSIGIAGELKNSFVSAATAIEYKCFTHHMNKPPMVMEGKISHHLESLFKYIQQLDTCLAEVKTEGLNCSSALYVANWHCKQEFLAQRNINDSHIKEAKDLKALCQAAHTLLEKYIVFYKNSIEHVHDLIHLRSEIESIIESLRGFVYENRPSETLKAANSRFIQTHDGIIEKCKELDHCITEGRIYNLIQIKKDPKTSKDEKRYVVHHYNWRRKNLLTLKGSDTASVRLYHIRSQNSDIISNDPIISSGNTVWIELIGLRLAGFLHYSWRQKPLPSKKLEVKNRSYKVLALGYHTDNKLIKSLGLGRNSNRYEFVINKSPVNHEQGQQLSSNTNIEITIQSTHMKSRQLTSEKEHLSLKKEIKNQEASTFHFELDEREDPLKKAYHTYLMQTKNHIYLPAVNQQSATLFYSGRPTASLWYDDNKLNMLLNAYCRGSNVEVIESLSFDSADEIEAELISARLVSKFSPEKKRYFLPLRVNSNHWIGLYIDRQLHDSAIYWLDPFGNPPQFRGRLVEILNRTNFFAHNITANNIHIQTQRLQQDGFNCGPWVIEMLRFILEHNGNLPNLGDIDIAAKRIEHQETIATIVNLAHCREALAPR